MQCNVLVTAEEITLDDRNDVAENREDMRAHRKRACNTVVFSC